MWLARVVGLNEKTVAMGGTTMPIRNPTPHDTSALSRDLDSHSRGLLRVDIPNHWAENVHALSNLAYAQVLHPWAFDELIEVNKQVVIARVKHMLDVLNKRYLRKVPPQEMNLWQLQNRVLYVRTEDM